VRHLIALALILFGGSAWADEVITPEAGKPDVVYIGKGWPSNFSDGCADRSECQLPLLRKDEQRVYPTARTGKGSFAGIGGGDCSGAVQGVSDIASMYQVVTRCVTGN